MNSQERFSFHGNMGAKPTFVVVINIFKSILLKFQIVSFVI